MMKKIGGALLILSLIFSVIPHVVLSETPEAQRAALEAELKELEREIAEKQAILDKQRKQTGSLKRDVTILQTEIAKAQANIRAKTLLVTKLNKEIGQKSQTIEELRNKINLNESSIADLIRKSNELDRQPIMHVVLSTESVSDFYADVEPFDNINAELKQKLIDIRGAKQKTEIEKVNLEKKQDQELDAKAALENSKKKVEVSKKEKDTLLKISQNKESEYAKVLAERQARAAQIRATLFKFRDAGAIPFGKALEYAELAQKKTGVRPAFLLAIIQQESNLGQNVGSCYMTNTSNGSGVRITSGAPLAKVMKPDRDITPFLRITKDLGMDYARTRVSCPLSYGYGGAMGPAQFIPSTWALMENKIAKALGVATPDPWNHYHALMASAIFLSDLGANQGTYSAERNAACRYYSGRSCSGNTNGTTYGNQVMNRASNIQTNMIDPLNF